MDSPQLLVRILPQRLLFIRVVKAMWQYSEFLLPAESSSIAANLRQGLSTFPFPSDTHTVTIIVDTPSFLIPLETLEQADEREVLSRLYNYNMGEPRGRAQVLFDALPSLNLAIVYSISGEVFHEIEEAFTKVRFRHALSSVLPKLSATATKEAQYFIVPAMGESRLCVICFRDGVPLSVVRFPFSNSADIAYGLLLLSESLELERSAPVYLLPSSDFPTDLCAQLSAAGFAQVKHVDIPQTFGNGALLLHQAGMPYDLCMKVEGYC